MFLNWRSVLLLILAAASSAVQAYHMGQQCDWTGSGGGGGGVTPVYLRCREGTVRWTPPAGGGALRVVLRAPPRGGRSGGPGGGYRACLRPGPDSRGASLFLQGPKSLVPLYKAEDDPGKKRPVKCFQGGGASPRTAVYVEAAPLASDAQGPQRVALFSYHLQPLAPGTVYDPSEECRPCTKEEMMQAFCTSELVVRGIIQRVEPSEDDDSDVSEITVKVSKTLRESTPEWRHQQMSEGETFNDIDGGGSREGGSDTVVLTTPRHCGARHGPDQLVVMATTKLDQLVLTCAPTLEQWATVVQAARNNDSAQCLMYS